MHFTGTVYRNPYWPTWPLLEITQGCTHNRCKFCTMYKDVPFRMSPMEWIEEDLRELAQTDPDARTIQLLSANPLVLSFDRLAPILEMINRYLPKMEYIYLAGRVTDLKNKTVEELKKLKALPDFQAQYDALVQSRIDDFNAVTQAFVNIGNLSADVEAPRGAGRLYCI